MRADAQGGGRYALQLVTQHSSPEYLDVLLSLSMQYYQTGQHDKAIRVLSPLAEGTYLRAARLRVRVRAIAWRPPQHLHARGQRSRRTASWWT